MNEEAFLKRDIVHARPELIKKKVSELHALYLWLKMEIV